MTWYSSCISGRWVSWFFVFHGYGEKEGRHEKMVLRSKGDPEHPSVCSAMPWGRRALSP